MLLHQADWIMVETIIKVQIGGADYSLSNTFPATNRNSPWWLFLQGFLLVPFLAAWIINRRMDIPLTMSNIRQIRSSDKDPGEKKTNKRKEKIRICKKRFMVLAGVLWLFSFKSRNLEFTKSHEPQSLEVPAAKQTSEKSGILRTSHWKTV